MTGLGRGVLHQRTQSTFTEVVRHEPGEAARPYVEFYWHVRWNVREPYETKVLAHPNVHLVFEEPEPLVYGVDRNLFTRMLEGRGQVLGIKFRPGGFRPFTEGPVLGLADRRVPAAAFFGAEVAEVSRRVLEAGDSAAMARLAEAFLVPRLPAAVDPTAAEVAAMAERITASPGLCRVEAAAAEFGVSVRHLQRLFAEYVGASPKWVLRRARLHEAATRADAGAPIDWATLATDLGYTDQAHLVHDFTATVGTSPARYARTP
ncbi:MAG: helix-turn-helix domain-containing protein [Streptosporangiales bacterium]|nr:helix-turn-helix domain-containing protein [Streptosporangiales bacterium]